jgi:hypothetical protein
MEPSRVIFNDSIHLYFSKNTNKDNLTNVYESLLNKFRREGKFESYQRLDIEYRNKLAERGNLIDKAGNLLNWAWWNYGYAKSRVIGWTLAFLLLFFCSNIALWKKMQEIYPIDSKNILKNRLTLANKIRYYSSILLYTSILFFSLKIDLERLKFSSTRMVAFFFFQYMVGLICLLFITSSIFKI